MKPDEQMQFENDFAMTEANQIEILFDEEVSASEDQEFFCESSRYRDHRIVS